MPELWTYDITLIIITHNRRDRLQETLTRLRWSSPKVSCIVIDNASSDGTCDMVETGFPNVTFIRNDANIGACARNIGVENSRTPFIAFCDDDTWWEADALRRAVHLMHRHPRLAVLTARIIVEPEGREDPICLDMAASPLPRTNGYPGYPLISFLAGASVVRRSAFLAVGGFNPALFFNGEEELLSCDLLDAGWHLSYVPEMIVHHHPSPQRDTTLQTRRGLRNTLWFAWMRRPLRSSLRRTYLLSRKVQWNRATLGGFWDALVGAPQIIRQRRRIKPEIEQLYQTIEASQIRSTAVNY